MDTLKDCNTCAYHKQAERPSLNCKLCLAISPVNLPGWKPMSKTYDAAFRPEEPTPAKTIADLAAACLCGPRLEAPQGKIKSDGSSADYYVLPEGATQLQDLIAFKNMNAQVGEIFRACYRYGQVEHSEQLRDAKKMLFYAKAEVERLEKYRSKA